MKVVTAGLRFLDIDAYAGCIAYAELLRLQGHDAIAYSSAVLNESITNTIRSWDVSFSSEYRRNDKDTFVLIDVSDPEFLDSAVDIERVEEVIDHHVGHEQFWQDKIGSKANIEFIGAACTQVFESWEKSGLVDQMSKVSAQLLISGILDNTLNFKAQVATDRDKRAYEVLSEIAGLPDDWPSTYFQECEQSIFRDIRGALSNDTKLMKFIHIDLSEIAVGQLVIWNAERVLTRYRDDIKAVMQETGGDWFVNIVSIDEGRSYFLASNDKIVMLLEQILKVEFLDYLAAADRLWLRKEIARQDMRSA